MADSTRFKARKTTYKGVEMRSRLEAGFAQWCDQNGILWEYEPGALAGVNGQWLPDFKIAALWFNGGFRYMNTYVEVKPPPFVADPRNIKVADFWYTLADSQLPYGAFFLATPLGLCQPIFCDDDEHNDWLSISAFRVYEDITAEITDKVTFETTTVEVPAWPFTTVFTQSLEETLPWQGEWWKPR